MDLNIYVLSRSSPAYGELEERLELLESSMTPVSPHMEERMELLESLINREEEEEHSRHSKRSAEQVCLQSECNVLVFCWLIIHNE